MNRQNNRPKPSERRPRPMKGAQPPREIPDTAPMQVYSTVGGSMLDNVLVIDKNMLVPMEVQRGAQPRQQFVNLDHQFVRQAAPPARTTQNTQNVQILQNIAIRPPTSTNVGNPNAPTPRRYQQQQATAPYPSAQQLNINPRLARNITTLPPGGQFLAVQRAPPATVVQQPMVQLQRSASSISLLQEVTRPVAPLAGVPAQQGRLPMVTFKDYPEYRIILHEFTQHHKATMFRLSSLVHNIFNPLLVANGYVLLVSVNYTQFICFEVDAKIFGDFICRLVPRMLEMCNLPFVLEIKDAPSNWANELKKSIVIGKNNYELAARKIADCFRNKDVVCNEIPYKLEIQFMVRRNFIGIKAGPVRETMECIRVEYAKRHKYARSREPKDKCEAGTQTEEGVVLPSLVLLQHKMQLDMVNASQGKRMYRDGVQMDHTRRMEQSQRVHTDLLADIQNKVASLMDVTRDRPKAKIKKELDWETLRSKGIQTDAPPQCTNYADIHCPVLVSMIKEEYIEVTKQLMLHSVERHKQTTQILQKLQKENDMLYQEFLKKAKKEKDEEKHKSDKRHREKDKKDKKDDKKGDARKDKDDKDEKDKKTEPKSRSSSSKTHKESSTASDTYLKKPPVAVVSLEDHLGAYKFLLGGSVAVHFDGSAPIPELPEWDKRVDDMHFSNFKDMMLLTDDELLQIMNTVDVKPLQPGV